MACWLMFLQKVSDSIKVIEPNLYKRKQLSIELLKEMEFEESHDNEKIGKLIDKEGDRGLIGRAKEIKKRRKKTEEKEEEEIEAVAEQEEV